MTGPCIQDRIDAAYKMIAAKGYTKSGRVKGSASYDFIPIKEILDGVREAHAACGVKVLFGRPLYDPEQCEKRWTEVRKSRNPATGEAYETRWQCANGHMDVRLIGGSDDDEIVTTIGFEAQDNSDKLTNKIYTNAERSLYRTLYAIDEGEGSDPEALNIESSTLAETRKREEAEIRAIAGDAYIDGAEFLAQRDRDMAAVDLDAAKRKLMAVYRKDPRLLDRWVQMENGRQPPAWSEDHIRRAYLELEGDE